MLANCYLLMALNKKIKLLAKI